MDVFELLAKVLFVALQTEFLCNIIKFIKRSKKFIDVLLILLYLYIKFQHQIHRNERAIKKIKFLIYSISQICQKFLFFIAKI
jgi:hypothetical protein